MPHSTKSLSRTLSHLFPGLKRKHLFHVEIQLEELMAVPFLTGSFYCKINLSEGTHFKSETRSMEVKKHIIVWRQLYTFQCTLYSSKDTCVLDPCPCKITIFQEATGEAKGRKIGYVLVDLSEYTGCGSQKIGLLIQPKKKNERVGNSILTVTASLKILSGDLIYRTPGAFKGIMYNQMMIIKTRGSIDTDHSHNNKIMRAEMRPDMEPQGVVVVIDSIETRADNNRAELSIRRNSVTATYKSIGSNETDRVAKYNAQLEHMKQHDTLDDAIIDAFYAKSLLEEDKTRYSRKSIDSNRIQRHEFFSEKTMFLIDSRISSYEAVNEIFESIGIWKDGKEPRNTKTFTLENTISIGVNLSEKQEYLWEQMSVSSKEASPKSLPNFDKILSKHQGSELSLASLFEKEGEFSGSSESEKSSQPISTLKKDSVESKDLTNYTGGEIENQSKSKFIENQKKHQVLKAIKGKQKQPKIERESSKKSEKELEISNKKIEYQKQTHKAAVQQLQKDIADHLQRDPRVKLPAFSAIQLEEEEEKNLKNQRAFATLKRTESFLKGTEDGN